MQKTYEQKAKAARQRLEKAKDAVKRAKNALEKVFDEKYSEGRFFIKRMPAGYNNPVEAYELWWENGWKKKIGLSTKKPYMMQEKFQEEALIKEGIYKCYSRGRARWNSKLTQYVSLDKMMKATEKFGIPPALVKAFKEKYNGKEAS